MKSNRKEQTAGYSKLSYAKYMLCKKIPRRFGMILLPEAGLSLFLYFLVVIRLASPVYRPLHLAALFGFWGFTWWLSRKNRHHTHYLRHYYLCNLSAYGLFLLVAFGAFMLNYHSTLFPKDYIYYPCFRLSYILALLPTKKVNVTTLPFSMGVFYSVTFAIILLEPLIAVLRHKKWNTTKPRGHR